jgi:hypothetical protein
MPPPVDPPPVGPVTYTDLKSGVHYTLPSYIAPIYQSINMDAHNGSSTFSAGNDTFYIQYDGKHYLWNTPNRELTTI